MEGVKPESIQRAVELLSAAPGGSRDALRDQEEVVQQKVGMAIGAVTSTDRTVPDAALALSLAKKLPLIRLFPINENP